LNSHTKYLNYQLFQKLNLNERVNHFQKVKPKHGIFYLKW
jgi:hypothetical protein